MADHDMKDEWDDDEFESLFNKFEDDELPEDDEPKVAKAMDRGELDRMLKYILGF